jgi:hypothetical protein
MSAAHYRRQLEDMARKLVEATTSAREWRLVAQNRLELLGEIHKLMDFQVERLKEVGEVFGVSYSAPEDTRLPVGERSGEAVARSAVERIREASEFTGALAMESASVQIKLTDVLQIATEAILVERPLVDLSAPNLTEEIDDAKSPLESVSHSLSPKEDRDFSGASSSTVDPTSSQATVAKVVQSNSLSLFKK